MYKDMSKYRDGREQSKVARVWVNQYKDYVLHDVFGMKKAQAEFESPQLFELFRIGTPETATAVVSKLIRWIDSPVGHNFIRDAFEVEPGEQYVGVYQSTWKEYQQTTLSNVIYRTGNPDSVSEEDWNAIHNGSPDTVEIVVDTLVGWFNSHAGRSFLKKALNAPIPTIAPDGSE